MDWVEIGVGTDNEAVEATSAFLSRFGSVAVEELLAAPTGGEPLERRITVRCYLSAEQAVRDRSTIEEGLWHLSQLLPLELPQFRSLADTDWMEAWKEHYSVIHVSDRVVIVPSWKPYSQAPGEIVVRVDPGMAFGTGLHPSTQQALDSLERFLRPGDVVLDVGTGTGILAIAAVKLGATGVLALDIDEAAVRAARLNAEANGVGGRIRVALGSVIAVERRSGPLPAVVEQGAYDLLLVNIIAEVIREMAPALLRLVRPGGAIVTAGVIKEREQLVTEAFAGSTEVVNRAQEGDWVSLTLRRNA